MRNFRRPMTGPLLEPYPRSRMGCVCQFWQGMREWLVSSVACCCWASLFRTVWTSTKDDPAARAIHAFKMALALILAFLLILLDAPYELLSTHAIWAVMTVVVVFEFSIGATLSKGCNRGAGTLLAGLLAIVIGQLAGMSGSVARPIMIGLSVFVIGGVVSFTKLWPTMKVYEVGCRTFLITFSLIMVAEYTGGNPLSTAVNRFLIIMLGAAIGFAVNVFVFPCWAGEDLHQFIANNFESVADSLEVCVSEYLRGTTLERVPSRILMGLAADNPVYKGYRSALVSASKEESLATFASWEPPHGRFRMFKYPWRYYVKVGAVLRHCTYSVVALHGCLGSAIQAPLAVRKLFESELHAIGAEAALVLRKLGKYVKNMQKGDLITILDGVQHAVYRLQQSLYLHSYLLVQQETGILEDKGEALSASVIPELVGPENGANSNSLSYAQLTNKMAYAHDSTDTSRRSFKKLHSWPSRPMDDFDFAKNSVFQQRVRVLESSSVLSFGTFATLLMEVALRLDYVVDAVEELGTLAKFKAVNEHIDAGSQLQDGEHPP